MMLFFALIAASAAVVHGIPSRAADAATHVILLRLGDRATGKLRSGYVVTGRARGSCWTGSIAAPRSDAWRCMTGNDIYDPCFALTDNARTVYCPGPLSTKHVYAIALTHPLPLDTRNERPPSTAGMPTTIVLVGGVECNMFTGATDLVAGMRRSYGCRDRRSLFGDVDRSKPLWRIHANPPGKTSGMTLVNIAIALF